MKKILIALMLISVLPVEARILEENNFIEIRADLAENQDEMSFDQGNFSYSVAGETVSVKYIGNGTNVTFPTQVIHEGDTLHVSVVDGAPGNNTLLKVIIPDGIKRISPKAFAECSKLTAIQLPADNNITVGNDAFSWCPALTTVSNYSFFAKDKGPNDAVKDFFRVCEDSPKMLDALSKQMLTKCKIDWLYSFIENYLYKDYYYGNFKIGNYKASDVLGKKLFVAIAANGDWNAMAEICNRRITAPDGAITSADYLKYAKLLITKKPEYGYYYMGWAYEKGIGVTPSRRQAHYYYAKGRELNDKDCDNGWWRTL